MMPRVRIVDARAAGEHDAAYWRSKTPAERVAAVEFLRRQCYYTTGKTEMPRLVKILKLVDGRE